MRERISTFSISREMRKRISYFMFWVIFLSSIANFMFIILPRILNPPSEHIKVNQVLCKDKNQNVKIGKDEFKHIKDTQEHDYMVNKKYCNGNQCKFLLAYFPAISDTHFDFTPYVKLAESLGRIVVLTNVGPERTSTCQRYPFNFYYDVDELQRTFPNVNFISQDDFQRWTYHRIDKPSTSHYYLTDGGKVNSVHDLVPYSDSLKKIWCFDKFKLKLNDTTPFKQLRISWNPEEIDVLQNFLSINLDDNSEVLLIRHDVRRPLLADEFSSLSYSKYILDSSTKIINSLRPFIAIGWDIEHTRSSILSICASNLLKRVQRTIDNTSIENIYFSSDYPLHRLKEVSSSEPVIYSYRRFSPSHTEMMKSISFPYYTADSLGVIKGLEKELKYDLEDSGIRDIIDKLVSLKADIYIGLPMWPCNEYIDSGRSKSIVGERKEIDSPVLRF